MPLLVSITSAINTQLTPFLEALATGILSNRIHVMNISRHIFITQYMFLLIEHVS